MCIRDSAKAGGGEVHEMGVTLLVLMPIPYVDASSASAFRDKRSRVLVGAGGMLAELFMAAIAVFFWVHLEPGFERSIAYNVLLVAGVTTLLFNLNPLLRYDGYYILSDYLEIPNLGQRANDYVGYLVNHYLFGVDGGTSPVTNPSERGWFVAYAIGAFIYRMIMMVSIVLLIASQFFIVGIVLAIWAFSNMLIMPVGKKLSYLFTSPRLVNHRRRAILTSGAILGVTAALLVWLPAPSVTRAEGVIWAPEQAQVRATVDGFVTQVLAQPNQRVKKGDVLIVSEDPELAARTRALEAQMAELEARYDALRVSKLVQAELINEQRSHVAAALDLAHRKLAELEVRSPADGTFIIEKSQNTPGRFAQRGEVLAYVIDSQANTVRVVVPQAEGDLVRTRTEKAEIRSVTAIGTPVQARIQRAVPAATDDVPSMTLSLQGGGKIGMDPSRSGEGKALEKLFVLDLELPAGAQATYLGGRVYVRFEHPAEPLAQQWYRGVRRAFLKRFSV